MGRRLPKAEIDSLLEQRSAAELTETLHPFVTEARREKFEAILAARVASVAVAVENPFDPHNASAVIRSAEALGLHEVHVLNASLRILRSRTVTAGTHHWIGLQTYAGGARVPGTDFGEVEPALDAFFARMGSDGMRVAGACVDGACELESIPVDQPICLLFGNEHTGLSASAVARCDLTFRVPMHGFAESLNLSVCAALSMYQTLARRRAHMGALGDLDPQQIARERARWYLTSVDARTIRGCFRARGKDRESG